MQANPILPTIKFPNKNEIINRKPKPRPEIILTFPRPLINLTNSIGHLKNQYIEDDFLKTLTIDAQLEFEDISFDLAMAINGLRPFGMANPEPVFLFYR